VGRAAEHRLGVAAFHQLTPSAALAHVRLTDVAAEATRIVRAELPAGSDGSHATVTTGAIYQVWPSQADFQVDLLFHIAEHYASADSMIDELPPMIAAAAASGQPAAETLRLIIARSFEYTRTSALFYTSLCFYKHSADERVHQAMRRCTHAFVEGIRPVWLLLLDAYGLRVRAPYTVDNLARNHRWPHRRAVTRVGQQPGADRRSLRPGRVVPHLPDRPDDLRADDRAPLRFVIPGGPACHVPHRASGGTRRRCALDDSRARGLTPGRNG